MDGIFSPVASAPATNAPPVLRPRRLTDAQIRIIRLTVARACTDAEFDHFIAVAERTGLDPLRRQISAIVLNDRDPDKRSMLPQVTIDGLRAIAARHGDYRPMEGAPVIEVDPDKIELDINPLGIVRAQVTVWRRFDEAWFAITGEAWWDEYAALSDPAEGETQEPRARKLAQSWRRMGRVLIAKCAEAQALRRGWPEDLSGLYSEEELNRAELDQILGHERVARAEAQAQQRALAGARSLLLAFAAGAPLEAVGRAEIAQKLAAFIATAANAAEIESFQDSNREALAAFWEWAPADALDIKRQAERAISRLKDEADASELQTETKPRPRARRRRAGAKARKMSKATNKVDQTAAS